MGLWDFTGKSEKIRTGRGDTYPPDKCPLCPAQGILSCSEMATGYADLDNSQTWALLTPMIAKNVIGISNELAEKI